ncbi:radical SAM protein [Desulfurivibrio alkaliphilus]|uniref:Radical SAM domain protein n=1 Tax=Desulfurivibrio alkaliphilus (strain DSM 19089 / UNIQEM U267 / AHT2) TaxID=589865 RepID=D6Z5C4_DESAT|nr:radical SAM protein [Desulfurivibrio alkaliphilus]ADH84781.1 Radical SAM domain protein [Desulfurivibrio alkaliphilus AHT 2]
MPQHPDHTPSLVYANARGEIKDLPDLLMAGRSGLDFQPPSLQALIPLPPGSELFVLPQRRPVGIDPDSGEALLLEDDPAEPGAPAQAVAAFIAPAHTAILGAAYQRESEEAVTLPLFAYTAVGWYRGRFWVCAWRSDHDRRQDFGRHRPEAIKKRTNRRLAAMSNNRLVQHLGKCCLTYGCPAAVNYFMDSFEAPLPTSPVCNARCLGCISLQPSGCCPATQDRIKFVPTPAEIAEIAGEHLAKTAHVASFGQGCEGEPLLQDDTIAAAIKLTRKRTAKGRINCNTNAGRPEALAKLVDAGLDAIRVSLNSAQDHYHKRYYRPLDFNLDRVRESIRHLKAGGKFVSLNYFVLPGFSDDPAEYNALCRLIEECRPDFIQLRNLNMDPDWYLTELEFAPTGEAMGIMAWRAALGRRFPKLGFGYFNPPPAGHRQRQRKGARS